MVELHGLRIDYRLGGHETLFLGNARDISLLVPQEIQKCVVFIGIEDQYGFVPGGTGFFMRPRFNERLKQDTYLVTALHNLIKAKNSENGNGKIYIRANLKDGSAETFATEYTDWFQHPNNDNEYVDVAAYPWRDEFNTIDYSPISWTLIEPIEKFNKIYVGDQVFLTGLYRTHYGEEKNEPIIRVGNIAMIPDGPIETSNLGDIAAYLLEIRSINGLSGSPVFVHFRGDRHPANYELPSDVLMASTDGEDLFFFLGLIHGHWSLPPTKHNSSGISTLENEKINEGIAIAVPREKIMEVILQPQLRELRKNKYWNSRPATTPDSVDYGEGGMYSRPDFMGDLKKASRPKPSEPDEGRSKTSE